MSFKFSIVCIFNSIYFDWFVYLIPIVLQDAFKFYALKLINPNDLKSALNKIYWVPIVCMHNTCIEKSLLAISFKILNPNFSSELSNKFFAEIYMQQYIVLWLRWLIFLNCFILISYIFTAYEKHFNRMLNFSTIGFYEISPITFICFSWWIFFAFYIINNILCTNCIKIRFYFHQKR